MINSLIKSPLRYPGGKSRAVKTIWKYIEPLEPKKLCSPFFGGGSLEIFCAQKGIKVHGYDNFQPLVDFWRWLLKDPKKLAKNVKEKGCTGAPWGSHVHPFFAAATKCGMVERGTFTLLT